MIAVGGHLIFAVTASEDVGFHSDVVFHLFLPYLSNIMEARGFVKRKLNFFSNIILPLTLLNVTHHTTRTNLHLTRTHAEGIAARATPSAIAFVKLGDTQVVSFKCHD
jgi:hypothetical protein